MPTNEASTITHEKWRQLFLTPDDRARSSYWFRYMQVLRWLQRQFGSIQINKPIFVLEFVSCLIGVCMATYLTIYYSTHRWFIAPAIVAWLALFGVPMFWAHRSNGAPMRIYQDLTGVALLALGAALSLAPIFAYGDIGGATTMCYILFGLQIMHT